MAHLQVNKKTHVSDDSRQAHCVDRKKMKYSGGREGERGKELKQTENTLKMDRKEVTWKL